MQKKKKTTNLFGFQAASEIYSFSPLQACPASSHYHPGSLSEGEKAWREAEESTFPEGDATLSGPKQHFMGMQETLLSLPGARFQGG